MLKIGGVGDPVRPELEANWGRAPAARSTAEAVRPIVATELTASQPPWRRQAATDAGRSIATLPTSG